MRKALLILLLSLIFQTSVCAAAVRIELDAPLTLTGTPLNFDVELSGWSRQEALVIDVFVDHNHIGRRPITEGITSIRFEEVPLTTGTHRLMVRSGRLTSETKFRVLPGWLSLLPPILAIGLALVTRDVMISLFLGIFGGSMILFQWNPAVALGRTMDHFILPALTNEDHAAIIIFTSLLGGMVGLLTKSGGTHGIVERLTPYATTSRRGQLATWAMGVLVFFDDYANTLIVGPTMRPITDKLRISREKLAYIVDSTAAPVVCLFPISTWVGFEIGLITDAFRQQGLPFDGYTTFLYSIPYRFYPIFALVMGFTIAATRFDFGAMRRAEQRAATSGELVAAGSRPIADYASAEVDPPAEIPKRAINAILPIVTVVVLTIVGLYLTGVGEVERQPETSTIAWLREILQHANSLYALMWASLSGLLMALALPLVQRILKVGEAMTAMVAGFKAMLMAILVLVLAWSLGAVCSELQTAHYLVGLMRDLVSPIWLPALTFVLAAAVAFATGSSWGTMAILEPLIIPIGHSLAVAAGHEVGSGTYMNLLLGSIASVLAGAVWGDHCSPISDTTILSSMATGCDHIAHVRTQLPYALVIGFMGILVGNIPSALGLPPWIALIFGATFIVLGVVGLERWQARREAT